MRLKRLAVFALLSVAVFLSACGDDCDGENPTVQLVNNGTGKADIQIKTSGGNTENVNNILVGSASERRSFAPGTIQFTISIFGVPDPIEYVLNSETCKEYTVVIDTNNTVVGSVKDLDKRVL